MHRLFVVENVFEIKQRGVVVSGKLDDPQGARFHIGDTVEIRRRDGTVVETTISGIPIGLAKVGMGEVLLRGVSKADIGPDDEIWLGGDPDGT